MIQLGWSSEEELLCIKDDGTVLVYDMFGTMQSMFSMGEEASVTKIVEAKVFPSSTGTGIAVLTSKYRVFLVNSVKDPKVRQLPQIPSKQGTCKIFFWIVMKENNMIYFFFRFNGTTNRVGDRIRKAETNKCPYIKRTGTYIAQTVGKSSPLGKVWF